MISLGRSCTSLVVMALLSGCATEPSLRSGPEQGFAEARRLLTDRVGIGPVGLEVQGDPGILPASVAKLAAEGVGGVVVRFGGASGPDRQRLLLAFDPPGSPADPLRAGRACGGDLAIPARAVAAPRRLLAVFCDGSRPVAEVNAVAGGPNTDDTERLIWRTTARLFPDDYPRSYGLRLFDRIGISLGGSFGF